MLKKEKVRNLGIAETYLRLENQNYKKVFPDFLYELRKLVWNPDSRNFGVF